MHKVLINSGWHPILITFEIPYNMSFQVQTTRNELISVNVIVRNKWDLVVL